MEHTERVPLFDTLVCFAAQQNLALAIQRICDTSFGENPWNSEWELCSVSYFFIYILLALWTQKFLFSSFFYLYIGWFHLFHFTLKCYIRTLLDDFSVFTVFSHFWACLNFPVQLTYPLPSSFLSISENHLLFPEINYTEILT